MRNIIPAGILAALLITSCGERKSPETPPADTSKPASAQTAQPAPSTTPVPPPSSTIGEPDTTDGTLTVTGSGALKGTWEFKDVTTTLEEEPMNGITQSVLTIQGHDGTSIRHIRLRLTRDNAPIDPGTYSILSPSGTPPRKLNARFEWGGTMFTSLEDAKGSVVLKSIQGDRAVGSFDLTLSTMDKGQGKEMVKGNFDLKYIH